MEIVHSIFSDDLKLYVNDSEVWSKQPSNKDKYWQSLLIERDPAVKPNLQRNSAGSDPEVWKEDPPLLRAKTSVFRLPVCSWLHYTEVPCPDWDLIRDGVCQYQSGFL